MKIIKKITVFILAMTIASALLLTGCGKNDKNEEREANALCTMQRAFVVE